MIGFSNSLYLIFNELAKRERLRLITIANEQIYVRTDTPDLDGAKKSLYEREYSNIQCADPSVIIDAGANIGTSSIFFAKKYPDAKVFAIEPEQGNYDILQKNTKKKSKTLFP